MSKVIVVVPKFISFSLVASTPLRISAISRDRESSAIAASIASAALLKRWVTADWISVIETAGEGVNAIR